MMTTDAPRPRRRLLGNIWVNIALALALTGIIVAFIGQPSSGSMSPTLEPGDRLIVNRLAYVAADPAPGDIVVFRPDDAWGEKPATGGNWFSQAFHWVGETTGIRPYVLVKRVIAGPGQTVECCDAQGRVLVDGEPLDEPYVVKDLPFVAGSLDCDSEPMSTRCFGPATVPEDSYLGARRQPGELSRFRVSLPRDGGSRRELLALDDARRRVRQGRAHPVADRAVGRAVDAKARSQTA